MYGYISLQHDDEDETAALRDRLTVYAEAEGLALVEIYIDRNVRPGQIIRPGLTVLLDAVLRTEGCGVLVPTVNHLSPASAVRRAVEVEIELLGGRLMVVEPEGEVPDVGGLVPPPQQLDQCGARQEK